MTNVLLWTHNPSKAKQILAFFEGSPLQLKTAKEIGITGEVEEDGDTLSANALKKARFGHDASGGHYWTLAEDTGVFINALGGEPGVRSARWLSETAATEDTMNYCLKRLEASTDRTAAFRTVAVLVSPRGQNYFFPGEVQGSFLTTPRVSPQPKMPYSPLFVPDGETMCWAEMDTAYENKISHRGKAMRLVRKFLELQEQ